MQIRDFDLSIHHTFNPLHIYCGLVDVGINRQNALRISWIYENAVFGYLEY